LKNRYQYSFSQTITIDEIKNVVKGLKNGKSSGIDGVINEYIKYIIDDMLHIYVLLFNMILDKCARYI
jgi:hypothetical protein